MLLKKGWVNDEMKGNIKIALEPNDNENKAMQNLWDAAKQFIGIQALFKKQDKKSNTSPKKNVKKKNNQNIKSAEGRRQ